MADLLRSATVHCGKKKVCTWIFFFPDKAWKGGKKQKNKEKSFMDGP